VRPHHEGASAASSTAVDARISFNPNQLLLVEIDKGIRKIPVWGAFCCRVRVERHVSKGARERSFHCGPDMARTRNDKESYGQLLLIRSVVSELDR
jgi:hypothetical protein